MSYKLQIYFQKAFIRLINKQRILWLFVVLLPLLIESLPVQAQRGSKIRTVVIDPGHGGRDPGAVGRRSKEKDIVLSVALKTGQYINQYLPDVKVIYTRTTDEFVELHRRASIANENDADIFISIHCNAMANNSRVHGAETFVMGEHRNQANLEVAKLENAAILLEDNAEEEYGGFDPNSPEAYIAFTLYQSEYKTQSIKLAQKVQDQFTNRVGRRDRSVQQAGFLVLYRTTMPSILVELGFLTHPREEEFLMSEQGQIYMASALFRAFRDYKKAYERENAIPPDLREDEIAFISSSSPVDVLADAERAAGIINRNEADKASEKAEVKAGQNHAKPNNPQQNAGPDKPVFKVQFATNRNNIPLSDNRFSRINNPEVYFHDGLYKYTSGSFATMEAALEHRARLKRQGYTDAFVVAFYNEERITMNHARELIKK